MEELLLQKKNDLEKYKKEINYYDRKVKFCRDMSVYVSISALVCIALSLILLIISRINGDKLGNDIFIISAVLYFLSCFIFLAGMIATKTPENYYMNKRFESDYKYWHIIRAYDVVISAEAAETFEASDT